MDLCWLFASNAIAEAIRGHSVQVGKVDNCVIALGADTPRNQLDIALKEVCVGRAEVSQKRDDLRFRYAVLP